MRKYANFVRKTDITKFDWSVEIHGGRVGDDVRVSCGRIGEMQEFLPS